MNEAKKLWAEKYGEVENTLDGIKNVKSVVTAFNTNIDAVIKISGKKLASLAKKENLDWESLNDISDYAIHTPQDVVKGAFRCFSKGIAEEWLIDDINAYNWLMENIGYDRLQMGGQGGIVANALSVCGVQKVINHCGSLPQKQADLFLKRENLFSFDMNGNMTPAYQINRSNDIPLIHWIIEFDKDDEFDFDGYRIVCPKANRFIATYDPVNSQLIIDKNFISYMDNAKAEAVVLSGYHALTAEKNGVSLVEKTVPIIEKWRKNGAIVHLEVASTQDETVRKAIVDKIASKVDSLGLNERETIEVLQVIGEKSLADICEAEVSAVNLFEAVSKIKQKTACRRIQMHMFGLYLTIQDSNFKITPEKTCAGMCLAAMIAAAKAGTGHINDENNLLWAKGKKASDVGLKELQSLSHYLKSRQLLDEGICDYEGYKVIAVPTILVEKPKTLVGMGDTISSVSLVGSL